MRTFIRVLHVSLTMASESRAGSSHQALPYHLCVSSSTFLHSVRTLFLFHLSTEYFVIPISPSHIELLKWCCKHALFACKAVEGGALQFPMQLKGTNMWWRGRKDGEETGTGQAEGRKSVVKDLNEKYS